MKFRILYIAIFAFLLLTSGQTPLTNLNILVIEESEQDRTKSRLLELNKLDSTLLVKGGWSESDLQEFAANNDNIYKQFRINLKEDLSKLNIESNWITFSPTQSFEKYDMVITISYTAEITKGGQIILLTTLNLYDFPQQPILIDSNWKSVKKELKRRIN